MDGQNSKFSIFQIHQKLINPRNFCLFLFSNLNFAQIEQQLKVINRSGKYQVNKEIGSGIFLNGTVQCARHFMWLSII